MFEVVRQRATLDKKIYKALEPELRTRLFEAQRQAQEAGIPLVILICGVQSSGRGELLALLNQWMDARLLSTHTFFPVTDEMAARPPFWRYWRSLPAAGRTAVLFGGWYDQPMQEYVQGKIDEDAYVRKLHRRIRFERTLADNGTLVLKFWLHLDRATQDRRLKDLRKNPRPGRKLGEDEIRMGKRYEQVLEAAMLAIRLTDRDTAPWVLVDAYDWRHRNRFVSDVLVHALQGAMDRRAQLSAQGTSSAAVLGEQPRAMSVLDSIDLTLALEKKSYNQQLDSLQHRLTELSWKAWRKGISTVLVFEGWDAAGKGGAIRRVCAGMDPRLYQLIGVAAPTDEEKAHHYLWRFWRHVPRAGFATIYDRSWYGRVLVERVEGFATEVEWRRAYAEINDFEEQLTENGILLLKFWMHISDDEQLRRFEERQQTPHKQHKITDEDWRNRERRAEYRAAVDDMVTYTSTDIAPWTLVSAEDKRHGRIQVLRQVVEQLEARLER